MCAKFVLFCIFNLIIREYDKRRYIYYLGTIFRNNSCTLHCKTNSFYQVSISTAFFENILFPRITLYQFILTIDEKPTIVCPIPEEISVGYSIWDRIYYGQCHIPGSQLGWNIYSRIFLLSGTLTWSELKLLSRAQNCEIPGRTMCYFEVAFTDMLS